MFTEADVSLGLIFPDLIFPGLIFPASGVPGLSISRFDAAHPRSMLLCGDLRFL